MNAAALKRAVDRLGELRCKLNALQGSERELAGEVRQAMGAAKLERVQTRRYLAILDARPTLTIDPKRFKRKAGDKAFWAAVTVTKKKALQYLAEADLAKLGTLKTTTTLRVIER